MSIALIFSKLEGLKEKSWLTTRKTLSFKRLNVTTATVLTKFGVAAFNIKEMGSIKHRNQYISGMDGEGNHQEI